jgi:hypothetical protein
VRKVVVIACLLAVAPTGCADKSVSFVPPDVSREDLVAVIARQGQVVNHEAEPGGPPLSPVETVVTDTVYYTLYGGAILLVGSFYVGLLVLKGMAASGRLP